MQVHGLPFSLSPSHSLHLPRTALLVGHHCHDSILLVSGKHFQTLGGSVSYISSIFDVLGVQMSVVSKVGSDFAYSSLIRHQPIVVDGHLTTEFFADFSVGEERLLRTGNICEPILPRDICLGERYYLGLAVGIVGEISTDTLEKMADVSERLVVDVQALIRTIDPETGLVVLRRLVETPFYRLLSRISFLKAAQDESPYIDIEAVKQKTCVIVTEGEFGCTVYCGDRTFKVPAFEANEVDPTGAGDSFLAGFSAGLYQGFSVEKAASMGNYFGALAVGQVGVPKFSVLDFQNMRGILAGNAIVDISTFNQEDTSQRLG